MSEFLPVIRCFVTTIRDMQAEMCDIKLKRSDDSLRFENEGLKHKLSASHTTVVEKQNKELREINGVLREENTGLANELCRTRDALLECRNVLEQERIQHGKDVSRADFPIEKVKLVKERLESYAKVLEGISRELDSGTFDRNNDVGLHAVTRFIKLNADDLDVAILGAVGTEVLNAITIEPQVKDS